MQKRIIIGLILVIAAAGLLLGLFLRQSAGDSILVPAGYGNFTITVTTSGELRAENSQKIYGPSGLSNRRLGIGSVQITDIVPEGTKVDSGDYVATLDRNKVLENLRNFEDELQKTRSKFIQHKLDTAMTLKQARNDLIDKEYALEEAKIRVEQSQYESPATQRQVKIDLKKARRNLQQARENYQLKKEQAKAKMTDVAVTLKQHKRRISDLKQLLQKFEVKAPDSGLVIYHKEWNGQKRQVGDKISSWDMVVATLPDLSSMISETYVNEIDISKVKPGQHVKIGVDAFPDKSYRGKVAKVANVGEKLEETNTKVFNVLVKLQAVDSILRPGMTTKNEIITGEYTDVHHIPLEALHSNDALQYVYLQKSRRIVKKQVKTGAKNANRIIIRQGLHQTDKVMLSRPENPDELKTIKLNETGHD